ncbi:hypothetical protein [Desulfomonile tiedjei]|uniref:Uncharacterized protein n=1 Tax=Desulfomonile tiedjei (strain ATCC 49306 / DSM 6799 / DCB-1) TaxID=706587 RepID=I4C8H5_DESTA|nr:hypothetical protein [Desulfomonile tiedjei]AFM25866.1 hypothetical protein Desti_3205 [Desulfomonile tiedjei DSM 6799]
MVVKERKIKKSSVDETTETDQAWWSDSSDDTDWLDHDSNHFDPDMNGMISPVIVDSVNFTSSRVASIRESHALLSQFSQKELKILMSLKRNTSPKAWTLREDLVVLTLAMSNREIAEVLTDRNKEAVKKRLQLLRSKGLSKRQPEEESAPQQNAL